ncbi:MAG: diaminopimelate epimerase [Paracoccaceae bacterium]|nr:diaminopimelate epimerase [Paracoccaceae bacterium]
MEQTPRPHGLPFLKMHGAGNDFVVIDQRGQGSLVTADLARAVGDRHRGVGFDQLVTIDTDPQADARLVFWNSDGSQAGACGNATRCVAHLLMDETGRDALTLRTERGLLRAERLGNGLIRVNMGQPQLDWAEVPLARDADTLHLPMPDDPAAVGMGNPHCIFFVPDAEAVDLTGRGPALEHDPLFPERTNVEFASLIGHDRLRMRVWERGAGVTLACGSGTCATAVAAARRGLTGRQVTVEVDGGTLQVDWAEDGVWLTGPVAHVFSGVLDPSLMALARSQPA